RAVEGVARSDADAARRVDDRVREVGRIAVLTQVRPEREVVAAGRHLELELLHIDRRAVRKGAELADLALAGGGNRELPHPHLEAAFRPREADARGIGVRGGGQDGEHREEGGGRPPHGVSYTREHWREASRIRGPTSGVCRRPTFCDGGARRMAGISRTGGDGMDLASGATTKGGRHAPFYANRCSLCTAAPAGRCHGTGEAGAHHLPDRRPLGPVGALSVRGQDASRRLRHTLAEPRAVRELRVHLRNALRKAGCLTADTRRTLARCAARATCGKETAVLCCTTETGTCSDPA